MRVSIRRLGVEPSMPSSRSAATRLCGHTSHIGCCSACQRAQLNRWAEQLRQAQEARFARNPAAPAGL
jgi:hypothetical protein